MPKAYMGKSIMLRSTSLTKSEAPLFDPGSSPFFGFAIHFRLRSMLLLTLWR
jgi:hypothetical protein